MSVHSKKPCSGQGAKRWALPMLLLGLVAAPAWAQDDGAPPMDTPASERLTLNVASTNDAGAQVSPEAWSGPRLLGVQFGVGAAAAAVTVPLTLWGASAVGGLSNSLIGAALPSLIMLLVLPPLAVTLSEFLVGQGLGAHPKFWSAFAVTLGTQLVAVAGGILLGLWAGNPTHVALFTLGEAILLPSAATLMLGISQHRAGPTLALGGSPARTLPPMVSLPILQGDF